MTQQYTDTKTEALLKGAGFTILETQSYYDPPIYLVGIDDGADQGLQYARRDRASDDVYTVAISHSPGDLTGLIEAGSWAAAPQSLKTRVVAECRKVHRTFLDDCTTGLKMNFNKDGKLPKPPKDELDTWALYKMAMKNPQVRATYVWGQPGIGKTYTAYRELRNGEKVYAITLTEETPAAELRGHFIPKGGEMEWHDGPFVRAMKEGARLVINEITHGSPDVWSILYPVLESKETAQLTLPTGELVIPHDDFHVICTDNSPPEELPQALKDRFDAIIKIDMPHDSAFEALPVEIRGAARKVMNAGLKSGKLPEVGLRSWFTVSKLMASGCSARQAFSLATGDTAKGIALADTHAISMTIEKEKSNG